MSPSVLFRLLRLAVCHMANPRATVWSRTPYMMGEVENWDHQYSQFTMLINAMEIARGGGRGAEWFPRQSQPCVQRHEGKMELMSCK